MAIDDETDVKLLKLRKQLGLAAVTLTDIQDASVQRLLEILPAGSEDGLPVLFELSKDEVCEVRRLLHIDRFPFPRPELLERRLAGFTPVTRIA